MLVANFEQHRSEKPESFEHLEIEGERLADDKLIDFDLGLV
jgi:hypothetical protein